MENNIVDMNNMVEFIYNHLNCNVDRDTIMEILDLEFVYLEELGIVGE